MSVGWLTGLSLAEGIPLALPGTCPRPEKQYGQWEEGNEDDEAGSKKITTAALAIVLVLNQQPLHNIAQLTHVGVVDDVENAG